jgi:hypothetical protein
MSFTPGTRAVISFAVDGIETARRQINSLGGSMEQLGGSITGSLKELAAFAGVGLGLGAIAGQVLGAQREFDKLNASLVTATGSTSNAAQAFGALQDFASTTPYSVKEATEAFIMMRNLGLDPSEKALRSYGNTAAAMGKDLNQMVEAVADAATGQFERLKEFGITAAQNGNQVALTFQGMTTKVGNNTKEIQGYLQNLGNVKFAGAMEARANTLDGAISNLGDTWAATMRTIAQNGVGDQMQSGVLSLSGSLTDLGVILNAVGGAAHKEGEKVKEASGLHEALTGTFKGIAAVGVLVAAGFQEVGEELGALAALSAAVLHGDLAGAKAIIAARVADGTSLKKATEDKINAIGRSTEVAQKAAADELAAREKMKASLAAGLISQAEYDRFLIKSRTDKLAGFAIELTSDEKRVKAKQDVFDIENKLNGVNAQTAGDLAKLKVALDTGAISQAEYAKYVAQTNKETIESSTAYKNQVKQLDMSTAAVKRRAEAQALLNQREQEHVEFLKNSGQINEEASIKRITALQVKDLENQISAAEAEKALAKKKIDSKTAVADLDGQISVLNTKISNRKQKEDEDLFSLDQKYFRIAADNYADVIENAQVEAKTQQDALRDQKNANAELGLTEKQIAALTASRLIDQAVRREEAAITAKNVDDAGLLTQAFRDQATALRERAAATIDGAELKRQKELWATIETTAHDTFVSIFDSGKSAFDRLRDTLKNGLLDLLYQMTIKKWIFNIGASVGLTGASGLAEAAGVAGGTGTPGATGLIGMAQTASNLYKAITGGFEALGDGVAGYVQQGLTAAGYTPTAASGLSTAGGQALTPFASQVGTVAGAAAAYMAGSALNSAISGQYSTSSGLMTAQKVATAVASYINPVLGVAVGAISGLVNRAFGMGNTEVKSQGISGTLSSGGLSGSSYQNLHQDGGWFRSDKNWTDKTAFSTEMAAQFTQGFDAIKAASAGFATSVGASVDSLSSYSKAFNIALTSDATANEKAISDFFLGVGNEIALRLVPGLATFSKSGETASSTLERLAGDFAATNQVAMVLGTNGAAMFGSLGVDSTTARERLIDLAGGVSTLSSQAASFAQNYMTEAQRLAPVATAVTAAMASLGLASITTRDQYAAHVEGLISSGAILQQAGAQEYTSLMALADAFAQVHPAIESTTAAVKSMADVLSERADLQKQYDQLTMTSAQLLAQQRDALDASNRALFDQVQAAQAAKDANDAAKASLGDFLSSTKSFADSVKGFNSNLLTGSLSTLTPEQQLAEARRQFEQTRQAAAAGDTTARSGLQEIENTFLTLSQKLNGGDAQYSSDMATVMQANDQLAQWTVSQVDVAQASLNALNAQVDGIATLNVTMWNMAQNIQSLPDMSSRNIAPIFTPVSLPNVDYASYGTSNLAPLLAEIKALREEVKGRRADAQQQTGDVIVGNARVIRDAAAEVIEGITEAANVRSWQIDARRTPY